MSYRVENGLSVPRRAHRLRNAISTAYPTTLMQRQYLRPGAVGLRVEQFLSQELTDPHVDVVIACDNGVRVLYRVIGRMLRVALQIWTRERHATWLCRARRCDSQQLSAVCCLSAWQGLR